MWVTGLLGAGVDVGDWVTGCGGRSGCSRDDLFILVLCVSCCRWRERILEELDAEKETVVLCHHGQRSMMLSNFLCQQGFKQVLNVAGGIDAYSSLDNSIPRY